MYSPDKKIRVGQKYIAIQKFNLEREEIHNVNRPITHSYFLKKQNENWKIFVNSGELAIFEIRKDGLLQKTNNVSIKFKLDEILYFMSGFALLLIILTPSVFLIPGQFLFVVLPIITTITYFLWKRINPFSMIDSIME